MSPSRSLLLRLRERIHRDARRLENTTLTTTSSVRIAREAIFRRQYEETLRAESGRIVRGARRKRVDGGWGGAPSVRVKVPESVIVPAVSYKRRWQAEQYDAGAKVANSVMLGRGGL